MMQAGRDYGVRVIKPFGRFPIGFVMTPPVMYREQLLKRGLVETVVAPVEEDQPKRLRQKPPLGLTR